MKKLSLRAMQLLAGACVVVMTGVMLVAALPALLGGESFVVSSGDMRPALNDSDLAIVKPVLVEQVAAGEIIVYRTAQDPLNVVTRRMLYSEPDAQGGVKLQVRGDSEPSTEQLVVQAGSMLGRLELSVPRIGLAVSFGNSLPGRALLLGLPVVLLAIDQTRKRLAARTAKPSAEPARIAALLDSGQRALAAGFPELALRAADGALALDAGNAAAALLKRVALSALEPERTRVLA